jgi:hypothetical protein
VFGDQQANSYYVTVLDLRGWLVRGKQVRLFLTKNDLAEFEKALRLAVPAVMFLRDHFRAAQPEVLPTISELEYGVDVLRVLIVRWQDLNKLEYTHIPARKEFFCSPIENPIIEFNRPYVTKEFIRAGRLYFIPSYWGESSKIAKPPEFVEWADSIIRLARRTLKRVSDKGYAGREALQLQEQGVRLDYP